MLNATNNGINGACKVIIKRNMATPVQLWDINDWSAGTLLNLAFFDLHNHITQESGIVLIMGDHNNRYLPHLMQVLNFLSQADFIIIVKGAEWFIQQQ